MKHPFDPLIFSLGLCLGVGSGVLYADLRHADRPSPQVATEDRPSPESPDRLYRMAQAEKGVAPPAGIDPCPEGEQCHAFVNGHDYLYYETGHGRTVEHLISCQSPAHDHLDLDECPDTGWFTRYGGHYYVCLPGDGWRHAGDCPNPLHR